MEPVVSYGTLTLLLAAWIVTHLLLVVRALRNRQLPRRARAASLFAPPAAPLIAWRRGRQRASALVWMVLGLAYGGAWIVIVASRPH